MFLIQCKIKLFVFVCSMSMFNVDYSMCFIFYAINQLENGLQTFQSAGVFIILYIPTADGQTYIREHMPPMINQFS